MVEAKKAGGSALACFAVVTHEAVDEMRVWPTAPNAPLDERDKRSGCDGLGAEHAEHVDRPHKDGSSADFASS